MAEKYSDELKVAFINVVIMSKLYKYVVSLGDNKYLFTDQLPILVKSEKEKQDYIRNIGKWCFFDFTLNEEILDFQVELPFIKDDTDRVYLVEEVATHVELIVPELNAAYKMYREHQDAYLEKKLIDLIGVKNYSLISSKPYRDIGLKEHFIDDSTMIEFYDLLSLETIGEKVRLTNEDIDDLDYDLKFICYMTNVRVYNELDNLIYVLNWPEDAYEVLPRYYDPAFDTYRRYITYFNEYDATGVINTGYYGKRFDRLEKAIEYADSIINIDNLKHESTTHVDLMVFLPGTPNDDIPTFEKTYLLRSREEYYNKYYNGY